MISRSYFLYFIYFLLLLSFSLYSRSVHKSYGLAYPLFWRVKNIFGRKMTFRRMKMFLNCWAVNRLPDNRLLIWETSFFDANNFKNRFFFLLVECKLWVWRLVKSSKCLKKLFEKLILRNTIRTKWIAKEKVFYTSDSIHKH